MKQVKVVHIVEAMAIGGLERNLAYIIEGLNQDRFNSEVWCLAREGEFAEELRNQGHTVKLIGLDNYYNPLNIFRLAYLLRKSGAKIIHTHAYFANTMGRIAGIIAGVPVIMAHIQNSHWTPEERSPRNYLIDRILSRFSAKVIACSEIARQFQQKVEQISPHRLVTIHNVTDMDKFNLKPVDQNYYSELRISKDDFIVGSVARLTKVKGHTFLLDAAGQLRSKLPNLKVVIVGYGTEAEILKEKTRILGLSDMVFFTGKRTDIPSLLGIFTVFVQPTLTREGLPLAITEAMAAGLPVVATDVGGVKEAVINGITGILVPPGDGTALAKAIFTLYKDPALLKKMKTAGHQLCLDKFNKTKMVAAIETLYTEGLKKKGISV
jgi:glycosyltransferase involved in cell wall biosynthesis